MTILELAIEAEFCGPISMGTVAVVRALRECSGLSLEAAVALVDRCTFAGERVAVRLPSNTAAEALLAALQRVPAASRIRASITSRGSA
ncbi:MAG: hypothetical protein ABIQ16_02010 [Polyangiaceae bacterium]